MKIATPLRGELSDYDGLFIPQPSAWRLQAGWPG